MQFKTETVVGLFIIVALGIFFYMTFFLGIFRFDRLNYKRYTIYFNNIAGLEKKAYVKIAGVDVGWVESIELVNSDFNAKADVMVLNKYILRADAQAFVRQESLLGPKYLEVIPGNPSNPPLQAEEIFKKTGRSPASMDEILHRVQEIACNVEAVSESLKMSFGGASGQDRLEVMVTNFQEASEKIAQFSSRLDRTLSMNETPINMIVHDLREFTQDLRKTFPQIKDNLNITTEAIEDAALQARDSFKNLTSITEKIDDGKGILGKLVNEDETYRDIKTTIRGINKWVSKIDQLSVIFDSHGEYMYRPAESVNFEDAKGYFNVRIHASEDHFYILQYMVSQRGNVKRKLAERRWYDERGVEFLPRELVDRGVAIPQLIGSIETRKRIFDQGRLGIQFAKLYKDIALRFGLIEGYAGVGVDFEIPFGNDWFRWVTTFEIFDLKGRDRFDDKRPHLKWINRLFILRNLYAVFGADDFISKRNANGIFGFGVRICDDDIKYLLSSVNIAAG